MGAHNTDRVFAGSIPEAYERHMVPLMFEPYAADLALRLSSRNPRDVLEIAAGTGVVTRAMAGMLPQNVAIIATDLNQAMLDHAAKLPIGRPVTWRQADAVQLPFGDATFDAVVCQFGTMFFPDKPAAFAEAHRVLRPGGVFIFSVWDRIEENEFADEATRALAAMFPQSPPRFLARTPHGYNDPAAIQRDLRAGGFNMTAEVATVSAHSRAESARIPALGFCQGTPLRAEIESIDPARLDEATDRAAQAIARRFGEHEVVGKIQALVVIATK